MNSALNRLADRILTVTRQFKWSRLRLNSICHITCSFLSLLLFNYRFSLNETPARNTHSIIRTCCLKLKQYTNEKYDCTVWLHLVSSDLPLTLVEVCGTFLLPSKISEPWESGVRVLGSKYTFKYTSQKLKSHKCGSYLNLFMSLAFCVPNVQTGSGIA